MTVMSSRSIHALGTTQCNRGHTHPPWNTTGVLRIAKCESQCGFCLKETKTAANLRKHVAIHIKNEGLNLTIAEGSSGRGRLEMPPSELERRPSSTVGQNSTSSGPGFSAPDVLLSMSQPPPQLPSYSSSPYNQQHRSSTSTTSTHSTPSPIPGVSHLSHPQPYTTNPAYHNMNDPISLHQHQERTATPLQKFHTQVSLSSPTLSHSSYPTYSQTNYNSQVPATVSPHIRIPPLSQLDPFHNLRAHNLHTKSAWTAIPASEGAMILEQCKRNSFVDGHDEHIYYSGSDQSSSSLRRDSLPLSPTSTSPESLRRESSQSRRGTYENLQDMGRVPCYNRKVLFDEEWQAHMRDVHGVFLLWPDTWMKRVEVLDLDPFGGDIGVCNDVIMDG